MKLTKLLLAITFLFPLVVNAFSFSQAGKVYATDCNLGMYIISIANSSSGDLDYFGWASPDVPGSWKLTRLAEDGNQVTYSIVSLKNQNTYTYRAVISGGAWQFLNSSVNGQESNTLPPTRFECGSETRAYRIVYPNSQSQPKATQTNQSDLYRNMLIGKWYIKDKRNVSSSNGTSVELFHQSVEEYAPNGAFSQQTQWIIRDYELEISCISTEVGEWSTFNAGFNETVTGVSVAPDYIKRNGVRINEPARLESACEVVKKVYDKNKLQLKAYTLDQINDSIRSYHFINKKGEIERATEYKVNQGIASYLIK